MKDTALGKIFKRKQEKKEKREFKNKNRESMRKDDKYMETD